MVIWDQSPSSQTRIVYKRLKLPTCFKLLANGVGKKYCRQIECIFQGSGLRIEI